MGRKRIKGGGFTLVELMIVVAIIGILAALAIYGVRKYVMNAKTLEARASVGRMGKDAVGAYSREGLAAALLPLGSSTGITNRFCSGTGFLSPVPGAVSSVRGKKYQSSPGEWTQSASWQGWICLRFAMSDPQFYMYRYISTAGSTAAGDTFSAIANGDLDGDTTTSAFVLTGSIQAAGAELTCALAPNIAETFPEE